MKKLIIWFFIVLCFSKAKAQGGELQFNQTKNFQYSKGYSSCSGSYHLLDSAIITVPVGKTLKIENIGVISYDNIGGCSGTVNVPYPLNYTGSSYVVLDNYTLFRSGSNNDVTVKFPLWLPSGSYKLYYESAVGYSLNTMKISISALEFNIIP